NGSLPHPRTVDLHSPVHIQHGLSLRGRWVHPVRRDAVYGRIRRAPLSDYSGTDATVCGGINRDRCGRTALLDYVLLRGASAGDQLDIRASLHIKTAASDARRRDGPTTGGG